STTGDPSLLRQTKLRLDVEAELIVFGKADPTASVMVGGHPVKLQNDGAFTVRMEFPDKRQVLPVTAETRDGLRQRTTVIAIERNTKVMDTVELQENN
ncbi:MAG: Rho termination protein, partial [Rhodopirellula bahusiensis]